LISRDEILVEVGDKAVPSFVVVSRAVRILRPSSVVETLIVVHRPGEVLGERNMPTACRALVRATSPHRACATSQSISTCFDADILNDGIGRYH
jgi:hypothetical protein